MKLDDFKDMASSMNSKGEREATHSFIKIALYTSPIWLPIIGWQSYQKYQEKQSLTPVAQMIKADLRYPAEFNMLYIKSPAQYKEKLALHQKDPERYPHPAQPDYAEDNLDDGGYYEKAFMDLDEDGVITKKEAAKWKKDKKPLDKHNELMQANYERFGKIEGYKELVQTMNAKTAHKVGLFATNYSENFKFLQNYYKDDLHGFRKVLIHGLIHLNKPNSDSLKKFWGGNLDLMYPVNQTQVKLLKEREKQRLAFDTMQREAADKVIERYRQNRAHGE